MSVVQVGCKVRLIADDGAYECVIRNSKDDILTVEKVVCLDSGKRLPGILNFSSHDILQIDVLEKKVIEVPKQDDKSCRRLLHKKEMPTSHFEHRSRKVLTTKDLLHDTLQEATTLIPQTDKLHSPTRTDQLEGHVSEYTNGITPPLPSAMKLPESYIVIEKIDEKFYAAVDHIREQSVIGLAMETVGFGRNATLCWMQVGTKKHVILFDMLELGSHCFDAGIGDVIRSDSIQKVIHDCRAMSDMLYHQYNILMVNVFDTQVAEVLTWRANCDPHLHYVNGLSYVLLRHLNCSMEQVFVHKMREESIQEEQSMWLVRPAPAILLDAAVKNVVYLRALRRSLLDALLREFIDGVDVYLSTIRDAPNPPDEQLQKKMHMLPTEFNNLAYHAAAYRKKWQDRDEKALTPHTAPSTSDQRRGHARDRTAKVTSPKQRLASRNSPTVQQQTGEEIQRVVSLNDPKCISNETTSKTKQDRHSPSDSESAQSDNNDDKSLAVKFKDLSSTQSGSQQPDLILVAGGHEQRLMGAQDNDKQTKVMTRRLSNRNKAALSDSSYLSDEGIRSSDSNDVYDVIPAASMRPVVSMVPEVGRGVGRDVAPKKASIGRAKALLDCAGDRAPDKLDRSPRRPGLGRAATLSSYS